MTAGSQIAGRTLSEWQEFARRDDCLDRMVPSDLRALVGRLAPTIAAKPPASGVDAVAEPVPYAWVRRFAYDGVDVMKMRDADRPRGWHLMDVTRSKFVDDDVPLYTRSAPSPAATSGSEAGGERVAFPADGELMVMDNGQRSCDFERWARGFELPLHMAESGLGRFYADDRTEWAWHSWSASLAKPASSPAGGWPSSGGLNADWVAMVLAEDARIEDGRLANGPYLAVKIADAADLPSEVDRLRTALANVRDHTRETSTATMAIGALSGSRISSPAGGDVQLRRAAECALGHLTGNMDGDWDHGDPVELLRAALSPSTSAAEPVAWVANCCHCGRIVDTREEKEGGDKFGCELTDGRWTCSPECWDAVVEPGSTPPAPAAVDGQRVKAEGFVDGYEAAMRDVNVFRVKIAEPFDSSFDTIKGFVADMLKDNAARLRACLATDKEGA